jgi:leucyl/phenylalanyl-tRNA--protein transferase
MRQSARKYSCTVNQAFTEVMTLCSTVHSDGNWITADFIAAYTELHRMGFAHSVEVWDSSSTLVGGLYGLRVNRFFAGESMFHTATDASKVALMYLVEIMQAAGMSLLDTQWRTDHLQTLGVVEVARATYLQMLAGAIAP